MIRSLEITNVGPAPKMRLDFGERLNLLTGDNGLGKSFLLDIVWWVMTRTWPAEVNPRLTAGKMALPTDKKREARIAFECAQATRTECDSAEFASKTQSWRMRRDARVRASFTADSPVESPPGLVLYALADGSFAIGDSARTAWREEGGAGALRPPAYVFGPKEVWDGLQREDGAWLCNGLIRDWAGWQKEKGRAFDLLKAVLSVLSPSPAEKIRPGELTRISLDDARDMPTLRMPYGQDVAVVHASSGMRRVIALAYFLVWCWEEHLKAKALLGEQPETGTLFLVDEVEAHLHPKWQRSVIPALMRVMDKLTDASAVQLLAVTHSPLVMASVEPLFTAKKDAWFDLDLTDGQVELTSRDFVKHGDAANWLTSEAFDLKSGYSLEAERALEEAARAMSGDDFDAARAGKLEKRLRRVLSDVDPFWIRWRFVAEKKGWLP